MIILYIFQDEQVVLSFFRVLVGPLQFVHEQFSVQGSSRLYSTKNLGSCSTVCTSLVVVAVDNSIQRSVTTTAEINHLVFIGFYESCRCGCRQLCDDDSGDKPSRVHLFVRVLSLWLKTTLYRGR